MKEIYTFKRDNATQIILCRPWSSPLCPLTRKMKNYLELKDHIVDPLCPNPAYPDTPNAAPPQKLQASRKRMVREYNKRSKNHQVGRRQYKVRIIEKPLLLSRTTANSTPRTNVTTTAAIPSTMSNPAIATTTWPSTTSTTANFFVLNLPNTLRSPKTPKPQRPNQTPRLWPRPYTPAPFTDWSSDDNCNKTSQRENEKISMVQRREQR